MSGLSNLAILGLAAGLCAVFGLKAYLLIQLTVMTVAGSAGVVQAGRFHPDPDGGGGIAEADPRQVGVKQDDGEYSNRAQALDVGSEFLIRRALTLLYVVGDHIVGLAHGHLTFCWNKCECRGIITLNCTSGRDFDPVRGLCFQSVSAVSEFAVGQSAHHRC